MTDDQREAIRVALEVLQSAGLAPQGVEAGGEVLAIRDAMSALQARLLPNRRDFWGNPMSTTSK